MSRKRGKNARKRKLLRATSNGFLASYEWRKLRMVVLKKCGARCGCCGASPRDGRVMHVDHIKPRRKYPELALVESNLQVLCDVCNHGKGNWDETDWRPEAAATADVTAEILDRLRPLWQKPAIH